MPELPEVEFVARQLQTELVGSRVVSAHVSWARTIGDMDTREFAERVARQTVRRIGRRGKLLLIFLDGGDVLAIHRRMSGNLYISPPATEDPYTRVSFSLDDGRRLLYSDPRKFGRLSLVAETDLDATFAGLGPEPLAREFTPDALAQRLATTKRAIKATLLDQAVIAGLGNIYADEALYCAGIHPLRPANSLTRDEIVALHGGIQTVLETGIRYGGTTIGRHRDAFNEAGTNVAHLNVYQHTGQPCRRCGTPIRRIVVAQRGTHYCPHCQPDSTVREKRPAIRE
ncbi:MAG TPA: DNA-formamidopyrimidine glycosylase [Ktedonobacterales bacterium]|nr:DNA-formamidopyrimidine glycosylase [Ktedonobacterales bacterium]